MDTLPVYLAIAVGGALGGALRYLVGTLIDTRTQSAFPWGTWWVNVSGSLLLGVLAGIAIRTSSPDALWAAGLMIGLCGSYTTVSSFSLQALELYRDGHRVVTMAYVLSSVVLCLAAAGLGMAVAAGGAMTP